MVNPVRNKNFKKIKFIQNQTFKKGQISNGVKYFKYLTKKFSQTKELGRILAKKIRSKKSNKAFVLGLRGDLGGGKTTFLQGFAKGLGIKQKVLSPTFVIMKKYNLDNRKWEVEDGKKTTNHCLPSIFYHIDCYRIQKPKEILSLGFKKIISDPKNIVAIEWADRIQKIMPKNTIWIKFKFIDANKRKIKIKNHL